MAGPEYTKEPTRVADWNNGTALVYGEGRVMTYNVGGERERHPVQVGNVRLFNGARNAVLELAEHLGCNAVELAERLEGGGLVKLVIELQCAANNRLSTDVPEDERGEHDYAKGWDALVTAARETIAALSHLTTAPR